jgi:hypothetical protein
MSIRHFVTPKDVRGMATITRRSPQITQMVPVFRMPTRVAQGQGITTFLPLNALRDDVD